MNETISRIAVRAAAKGGVSLISMGAKSFGKFLDEKSAQKEREREAEIQLLKETFACAKCGEEIQAGHSCCKDCGSEKFISLFEFGKLQEREAERDKEIARLKKHAKKHFKSLEVEYQKLLEHFETVRYCEACYVQADGDTFYCPTCGKTTSPLSTEMTITLIEEESPSSSILHGTFER